MIAYILIATIALIFLWNKIASQRAEIIKQKKISLVQRDQIINRDIRINSLNSKVLGLEKLNILQMEVFMPESETPAQEPNKPL